MYVYEFGFLVASATRIDRDWIDSRMRLHSRTNPPPDRQHNIPSLNAPEPAEEAEGVAPHDLPHQREEELLVAVHQVGPAHVDEDEAVFFFLFFFFLL